MEELRMGGYVNDVPYKMMRLRIAITGTNAPNDVQLSKGLARLLDHLVKYPLWLSEDDRE